MWKILAVDDDQGILAVIRKALEKEGYLVDTLEDPKKLEKNPGRNIWTVYFCVYYWDDFCGGHLLWSSPFGACGSEGKRDTFITEVCFFCKVSCDKVRNAIF